MNVSMVVCDLDGTLVRRDLTIAPAVQAVIKRLLTETQVRVVIATGRMHPSAVPFARLLGVQEPIITYQGAMIRQIGGLQSILHHTPIALPVAQKVLAMCKRLGLHLNVYINDKLYTEDHPHYVDLYRRTAAIEPNVVSTMEKTLLLPPTKLVIIEDEPEKMQAAHEALDEGFTAQEVFKCQSRPHFLELTAPGVTKWSAVQELASLWTISPANILCLGDQDNDLPMIEKAGWGIAMGNAPEFVKAKARFVVPAIEDDGAAVALEQYALLPALERAKEARRLGKPPSVAGLV
jgi:Cof subfamily protein (haloacid dehalogenase superfamily)